MNNLLSEPTIRFCENNLPGFIAQPANAYSSFIISVIGLTVLYKKRSRFSPWLGWIAILIGLTSFYYHASYTFLGQLFDLGSMFLLASFLIMAAFRREKLSLLQNTTLLVGGTITPLFLTYFFRTINGFNIGIPLFVILLLIAITLELKTARKEGRPLRWYGFAFLTFIVGWGIWLVDFNHIWCDATSFHFINGHAVWHLANGLALLVLDRYYATK